MALGKKLDRDALLRDLRGDEPEGPDAPRTPSLEAVEALHKDEEWARFFQLACENGPGYLKSQAWQWRDELEERGHRFDKTEIQDALLDLAVELLPDSPAGSEEAMWEAKRELLTRALYWLGPERTLDSGEVDRAHELSLAEFRAWLRARCREARAA